MRGLWRVATRAAMYNTARTAARPPTHPPSRPVQRATVPIQRRHAHQLGDRFAIQLTRSGLSNAVA